MLRAAPAVSLVALLSLSTLGLPGCSQEPESIEAIGEARGAARLADLDVTLPWGDATGAIGLRAPQAEFLGDGPSGIALGPDGEVTVVDRLHGRAVRVDAAGAHHAFALDADVEALAVGDDGAIALFSPLRSRVDLRTAEGAPLGEVAVPRTVGDVVGLSLGASRRVEIQTAYQERFVAGSANAPLDANAVLRTKREGAVSLDPDRALEALLDASGTAFVVVVATRDGERAHEERRLEVARGAASVRVLGVDRRAGRAPEARRHRGDLRHPRARRRLRRVGHGPRDRADDLGRRVGTAPVRERRRRGRRVHGAAARRATGRTQIRRRHRARRGCEVSRSLRFAPAALAAALALSSLATSSDAGAIDRAEVMARARAFALHPWRAATPNLTASCNPAYQSVYVPGDYVGLPYDWGGYMPLFEFDQDMDAGLGAGSYPDDGILACTSGLDCSGFVSQAWGTGHFTTSSLDETSNQIGMGSMLPGDVFNEAGFHVAMLQQLLSNGVPIFVEAIGYNVHYNATGGLAHVDGYIPRRLTSITGTNVVEPTGTPFNPIVVSSFPYADSRNTLQSSSDLFDGCGISPTKNESGREFVYQVTFAQPGSLTATVTDDAGVDIDVHVYTSTNTSDCFARNDATVTVNVDCGTYLVVADTFRSANGDQAGAYTLNMSFSPSGAACGSGPVGYSPEGQLGDACAYPSNENVPLLEQLVVLLEALRVGRRLRRHRRRVLRRHRGRRALLLDQRVLQRRPAPRSGADDRRRGPHRSGDDRLGWRRDGLRLGRRDRKWRRGGHGNGQWALRGR